jgi:hypothetical protein
LDLSGNNDQPPKSPDFIRPIASALKTNTSITELNLSGNNLNAEATGIFSKDMKDMESLSKLTFSGDHRKSKPVTVEVGMTEADFSGALMCKSGAMILAAWLKHKVQHDVD